MVAQEPLKLYVQVRILAPQLECLADGDYSGSIGTQGPMRVQDGFGDLIVEPRIARMREQ